MPDEDMATILADAEQQLDAELAELEGLSNDELDQLDRFVVEPYGDELECDEETPKLTDEEWRFVLDMEEGSDG